VSIKITRPLAFFDLETTGIVIGSDRIVEIAVLKLMPDNSKLLKHYLINPGMPIPAAATKVHGITDEKVKDAPAFKAIAHDLINFFDNADLAGYNSNKFDVPFLVDEFLRAGVDFDMKGRRMVDVQNIFHKKEKRDLSAAYKFYCDRTLENAHSAEADINATYEVLCAQLTRYPDLENNVEFLNEYSASGNFVDLAGRIVYNEKREEVFNFGKHKGKPVTEVFRNEPSYYDWMMKGEFPLQTKQVITSLRLRDFNQQKVGV
jgi:DNA polymerase-3 subunit epsilon